MQKMLECFGADISKTLVAKRKRLEQYTQNSLKSQGKKVEDIWKNQQAERYHHVHSSKGVHNWARKTQIGNSIPIPINLKVRLHLRFEK